MNQGWWAGRLYAVLALAAVAAWGAAAEPSRAGAGSPDVLVVGDSLAVGLKPFLSDALAPKRTISWSVRSGITTPQGMQRLRRARRRGISPPTVVVSLGTNDGPDRRRFASRLRRILTRLPADTCIVWPAVYRPPRKGAFEGINRELRAAALRDPRLTVIGWDRMVATRSVLLPDGLHPDEAGFKRRTRAIARAVQRGCAAR